MNPDEPRIKEIFGGKTNVQVRRCTLELPGATASKGRIFVAITHTGEAKFLDHDGSWKLYRHDPLHVMYERVYDEHGAPGREVGGGQFDDGAYIRVSPFTVWSIKLPDRSSHDEPLNVGLDLSRVETIRLSLECRTESKVFTL